MRHAGVLKMADEVGDVVESGCKAGISSGAGCGTSTNEASSMPFEAFSLPQAPAMDPSTSLYGDVAFRVVDVP